MANKLVPWPHQAAYDSIAPLLSIPGPVLRERAKELEERVQTSIFEFKCVFHPSQIMYGWSQHLPWSLRLAQEGQAGIPLGHSPTNDSSRRVCLARPSPLLLPPVLI